MNKWTHYRHFDEFCREAEFDDADAYAPVHAADRCVFNSKKIENHIAALSLIEDILRLVDQLPRSRDAR